MERAWLLEVEVNIAVPDPERLLAECEGFLVGGAGGQEIGVVEGIERDGTAGPVSALLVSAGWFGRRRLRVDADAIEELLPADRRIIVRDEALIPSSSGESSS